LTGLVNIIMMKIVSSISVIQRLVNLWGFASHSFCKFQSFKFT